MLSYMTDVAQGPLPDVKFYRMLRAAPLPRRAGRDAMGQLPDRAVRYCDASTQASSFGWWLFPPMDFKVMWKSNRILWSWGGRAEWFLLDAAQFPGYAAEFDASVPDEVRGYAPPFLTALPETGVVQIWTGFFARSAPGWSLNVRAPANLEPVTNSLTYEGIVEADVWFGPVFANIRLLRQDEPLHFSIERPILQVQPISRECYGDAAMNAMSLVPDLDAFTDLDWNDFARTVIEKNKTGRAKLASYAVAARRRRKAECALG
jgi:hypothetical protein